MNKFTVGVSSVAAHTKRSMIGRYIVRHFLILGSVLVTSAHADPTPIDWQQGIRLYETCAVCHGPNGNTSVGTFPKLSGQNPRYLRKQLLDYQSGLRQDPIMTPIAQKLNATALNDLLAYMGSFPPTHGAADPKKISRGEQLYRAGDRALEVPACAACHAPTGVGNNEAIFPALAGQNENYIIQQLQSFEEHKRTNDPKQMMETIAAHLSDTDKKALASVIFGLKSSAASGGSRTAG